MENLNNTHDTMTAGERAYADMDEVYIKCGLSAHSQLELINTTAKHAEIDASRYSLQEALTDAFRLPYDKAFIEYNEMKRFRSLPEETSMEIAFAHYNCTQCGRQKIISDVKFNIDTVSRLWECECGYRSVEVVER